MKFLVVVLAITAFAFAANDGCTETSAGVHAPQPTDGVTLSVVNDWALSGKCLGIDAFDNGSSIWISGSDNDNDYVQFWLNGTAAMTMPLSGSNPSCFGNAFNDEPTTQIFYTNDWTNSNIFITEDFGVTWATDANPAGSSGRGMDFDGSDYWTTGGTGNIWRFELGVGAQNLSVPEIPSQLSGLACFPYMGDVGIALTAYQTTNIYVYVWDGATLEYMGNAPCPGSPYRSYGLAYAPTTDHLYWSYGPSSGNYSIAELDFTVTSLSRDTWAGIKTSF